MKNFITVDEELEQAKVLLAEIRAAVEDLALIYEAGGDIDEPLSDLEVLVQLAGD